ncbi:MAG: helix-turn-helix domain-containing protein [Janthinobacterium lividum]
MPEAYGNQFCKDNKMQSKKTNDASTTLFEDLQTGLLEGIAHFRGEIELRTTTLSVPEPPPLYTAESVRALRTGLGFSQPYFSRLLNVSPKTVQSWEQGTRSPSQASARLLQLIENPHLLDGLRQQAPQQP